MEGVRVPVLGRDALIQTSARRVGTKTLAMSRQLKRQRPDDATEDGARVTEKIIRHSEALGGISRWTFQMNAGSLPHAKLMRAIETLGTRVAPALRNEPADTTLRPLSPSSGAKAPCTR